MRGEKSYSNKTTFTDTHDEYFRWHMLDGNRRSDTQPYSIRKDSPLPSVAEYLYFVLVYLKQNAILELIAEMFGITQAQ